MKKLVFMFAAVVATSFAVTFASCDGAASADTTAVDSIVEEVIDSVEEVIDSVATDSVAADSVQ